MSAPLLATEGLVKDFGGVRALDHVSLSVPPGIIMGVIGPNGAGKTTLFNAITGVIPFDAGNITFRERRISRLPTHAIARLGITRTFQTPQLFSEMTARENVMVGAHLRSRGGFFASSLKLPWVFAEERKVSEEADRWLTFTGLNHLSRCQAGSLPFGRQRLLEIARALALSPSLLLLDEPAAGLNMRETEDLGQLILRIRGLGITVLLVEHDMDLVMSISERLFVMDQGRRIAEGRPAEVRSQEAVIRAYLGEE